MDEELLNLQCFLDKHRIRFFNSREITLLRREGTYSVPERDKWLDIIPPLKIADAIRGLWNGPVNVNSGYRPPFYNKKVGGAEGSQHLFFTAVDLSPKEGDVEEFKALAMRVVKRYRDGGTNVGLGIYSWGVHIDVNAIDRPKNRTFGPEAPANF